VTIDIQVAAPFAGTNSYCLSFKRVWKWVGCWGGVFFFFIIYKYFILNVENMASLFHYWIKENNIEIISHSYIHALLLVWVVYYVACIIFVCVIKGTKYFILYLSEGSVLELMEILALIIIYIVHGIGSLYFMCNCWYDILFDYVLCVLYV
jgi:hypothetical protein